MQENTLPLPDMVRRAEMAERLGVSETSVDRYIKLGILKEPLRIGVRLTAWPRAYLDSVLANGLDFSSAQK